MSGRTHLSAHHSHQYAHSYLGRWTSVPHKKQDENKILLTPTHHHHTLNQTYLRILAQHLNLFLQTNWTPFYRCNVCTPSASASPRAPKHETDTFTYSKGLLYKHVTDSGKRFLTLVIPKSWRYMVLIEAQDKCGHQGNTHTYCLIKRQYYWKGMNKDICKYITACALCCREKAKAQLYPLQMTDIPDRPFNKITINLITEGNMLTSGNKHILTIIDHLTGWPEAYLIPDKTIDTIVFTFINEYLPIHMCPQYILSDNGTEFKNRLMDKTLQQLGID